MQDHGQSICPADLKHRVLTNILEITIFQGGSSTNVTWRQEFSIYRSTVLSLRGSKKHRFRPYPWLAPKILTGGGISKPPQFNRLGHLYLTSVRWRRFGAPSSTAATDITAANHHLELRSGSWRNSIPTCEEGRRHIYRTLSERLHLW